MEPHDEFLCCFVIDDLRSFEGASLGDVALRIVLDRKCHTFIFPIHEILGRVAGDTDESVAETLAFVLAEPIESVVINQDTATMGVDVLSPVVRPDLS